MHASTVDNTSMYNQVSLLRMLASSQHLVTNLLKRMSPSHQHDKRHYLSAACQTHAMIQCKSNNYSLGIASTCISSPTLAKRP